MTWRWRESGEVIARIIPKDQIPGFSKKEVIINPGEVAVLLKDGRIEDTLTQTRLAVQKGIIFKDKAADELVFIDTTPFDIEIPFEAYSQDHTKVQGVCAMRLQLNQVNAPRIIGLIKEQKVWIEKVKMKLRGKGIKAEVITKEHEVTEPGIEKYGLREEEKVGDFVKSVVLKSKESEIAEILTTDLLAARIESELLAQVIQPTIAKYDAQSLHQNPEIRREMEMSLEVELRKTFDMWGIGLIKAWVSWKSAYDQLMQYRRELELKTGAELAKLQMEHDLMRKQWEIEHDRELMGVKLEVEKERLRRKAEMELDREELEMALEARKRMHELKMEEERLRAEIEQKRIEAERAKYEFETLKKGMEEASKMQEAALERAAKVMDAAHKPRTLVEGGARAEVGVHHVEVEGKECPSCGEKVPIGAKFCPNCGEKL